LLRYWLPGLSQRELALNQGAPLKRRNETEKKRKGKKKRVTIRAVKAISRSGKVLQEGTKGKEQSPVG